MLLRSPRFLVILAVTGLLATASPVWARFVLKAFSTQRIDGVDALGNPSPANGAPSSGKIYKDPLTGVVLQVNRAVVENALDRGKIFKNRGLTMIDPDTYQTVTSTSDYTQVFVRIIPYQGASDDDTGWGAVEVKVFDPALVLVP